MKNEGQQLKRMERLVRPSYDYKDSFIEAVREFEAVGEKIYMRGTEPNDDFHKLLLKIGERGKGKNLPVDRVSQTELWLVENDEFIGWVKIRHLLNEKLLEDGGHIGYAVRPSKRKKGYGTKILGLALLEAKKLGIKKVLLTCDDNNIGSAKIIEKSGGILENKIQTEEKLKRRYWIINS